MSTLVNVIGSGAGIVAIAVCMVISRHLQRVPGVARSWVERGVVIVMYCAGSAIAVTELGSWVTLILNKVADVLGGINAGIPRAALLIACFAVMAAVLVSLIWEPNAATGMTAAFLPVILGMVSGGFLHQVYLATVIPGQSLVSALNYWLGG